ncbi:ATP-dependent Clp protease ATP-binding subunit CLPT2, chloroplastic [Diospyros lotus]|uniref:ATP-dependent Clp protease ATP-binding subunit CLPT2, chloroplastic n=1 Tax=Diospyros lotus TaxID=55363 RepID=UPI002255BC25|nr:ATP-dependent Clp protease ATP-binding subunit CLPT2, chloroplastic [Diospyros lotus]
MAAHSLSFSTPSTFARASQCDYRLSNSVPSSLTTSLRPESFDNPWLGTTKLSIQSTNIRPQLPKHRPIAATVSFSLPTAKPQRVSHGKVPKWSSKAIKSFAMAELEARKLKYPTTGTEALLMGILIEGTNLAAKFLMANGITLFKLREETIKLLGKADLFFFSPEHPPLTESAQRALDWAVDEKLKSGESGEITTTHLLLGIWSEKESAGHKILASLRFRAEKAKELETLISDPGFVDD